MLPPLKATIAFLLALHLDLRSEEHKQCSVGYEVMYEIARNERHPKRPVGYPFLISLNQPKNSAVLEEYKAMFLDKRTLDCKDKETCIAITDALIKSGMKNIDLGGFQFHYSSHPEKDLSVYFDLNASYAKACRFLEALAAKHGWGWETIGRYHSATPPHNKKYYSQIIERVQKQSGADDVQ